MEEKKEPPPETKKKPSLLWPMLLWPLVGVPMFWILFPLLFLVADKKYPHPRDLGFGWGIMLEAVLVSSGICFLIGAIIGYRFTRQTSGIRFPFNVAIGCGLGAAILCLVYNFGGCMVAAIGTAH